MNQTLLACLLALAAFTQAQASTGPIAASSSERQLAAAYKPRPTNRALAGQDTTKLGTSRGPRPALAGTYAQITQHLAELPAAVQPADSAPLAPSETPEFDAETANLPAALAITLRRPAAPLGRRTYRTRLVRTSRWATSREAVEILTCTYAGALVLAQLPATDAAPAQLLAGPGYDTNVPLRPLPLTQEAVLRLCGTRAPQVQAYARLYNLHFQQADDVARLLDYYNRIAVAVE